MALERISKIVRTLENEVVYAVGDPEAGTGFRMICSGCPGKDVEYNSAAAAILGVSYHAELDPDERFVPTTGNPRPAPRGSQEDKL
ncbi:hypothetical protein SEA_FRANKENWEENIE_174 [Streptomyces phage Frankenweenie]|nr:hypothetical protein SEA_FRANKENWEENIE_174 [Streptomyces phage Frankenweenie]